jgi:DNA polymerase-3 subunit chi
MPRVDRYYLETRPEDPAARNRFVCRLVEKAVHQGYRLVLQVRDAAEAEAFDQMLWTFRDRSFIPHGRDRNPRAPVWISLGEGDPETYPLLIQIDPDHPDPQWERYDRIAEITNPAQRDSAAGREREAAYRKAGFDFHEHDPKTAE